MKMFQILFSALFLSIAAFFSDLPLAIGLPISLLLSLLWLFNNKRVMRLLALSACAAITGAFLAYLLAQVVFFNGPALTFASFALALIGVAWVFDQFPGEKGIHFIADLAALRDPRTLELAESGLFDGALAVNLSALKDDREALAHLKKFEQIHHLDLIILDSHLSIERLCRDNGARWLTSGGSKFEVKPGLSIVDIDLIASRFQPLRREGESLEIKVQRPGKEEGQGVGYLEDGSMVVINGGGECIGCTIIAEVLSTKQTAAGRIIFCNMKNAPELV